jgi:hypothetical protein
VSLPSKIIELSVSFICISGAIAVSYVESCIISKPGPKKSEKVTLRDIYWRNLERKERVIFWTGSFMLISPFFLLALP